MDWSQTSRRGLSTDLGDKNKHLANFQSRRSRRFRQEKWSTGRRNCSTKMGKSRSGTPKSESSDSDHEDAWKMLDMLDEKTESTETDDILSGFKQS